MSLLVYRLLMALVLLPAASHAVVVSVTNELRDPVSDARLEVWFPPRADDSLSHLMAASHLSASTDSKGLADLPLATVEGTLLIVDHEYHAPLVMKLSGGPLASPLRLLQGAVLTGRIEFDGEQLDAGTVCAKWVTDFEQAWVGRRTWTRCAEIDPKGRFELGGLTDGPLEIEVKAPLFLPVRTVTRPGTPLRVRLERGILVSGRVLDRARGVPVASALVRTSEGNETATDEEGAFTLAVRDLPTSLQAGYPGYRTGVARVGAQSELENLSIELDAATQIAGTVLAEDGAPLEEVEVGIQSIGETRESRRQNVRTEEGGFTLDLELAGRISVFVSAPNYLEEQLPEVEISRGERIDYGLITLRRGSGVAGTILDAVTAEPVEGAEVGLLPLGTQLLAAIQRTGVRSAVSDSEGRFRVNGLGAGRFELRARRAGYATGVSHLTLDANLPQEIGDVMLERGVTLLAHVVDREGSPKVQLRVRLFDPEQSGLVPIAECTTGPTGSCETTKLAAGPYRVTVSGTRVLLSQEIEIPTNAEEFSEDFEVGGVHLFGVVLRDGEPVSGGTLSVASALDSSNQKGKYFISVPGTGEATGYGLSESRVSTRVQSDGRFEIEDAPSGGAWFSYGTNDGSVTRFLVVPDQAEAEVVVDLQGHTLRGQVVDADTGTGIEALVRVLDPQGATLALDWSLDDGSFMVKEISLERPTVEVKAEGYVSSLHQGVDVSTRAEPLIVPLDPGGEGGLTIRLSRGDGSPLAGVLATLLDAAGRMVRSLPTSASGQRKFRDLPSGVYFLAWSEPAAGTGISEPISVVADRPVEREFTVPPGSPVELVCAAEACDGESVDHVAVFSEHGVEIGSYLTGLAPQARFGAAARVSLGRLSPGSYHFRVWALGSVHDKQVTVGVGEPAQVIIQ